MSTVAERLRSARVAAGFASASEAARAMGIREQSYVSHENGLRGLARAADRYAAFYRVSLDWLLTGRGDMRGDRRVPLFGAVGAGARIESWLSPDVQDHVSDVELPDLKHAGALRVVGTSQWPKWEDGDLIIFDTRARRPADLVNQYCVVETIAGERLIKRLVRASTGSGWKLESHNAPAEIVELRAAYRCLFTIPG